MISESYVWFVWSVAFLIPWFALWLVFPRHRKAMVWASAFTAPFGLTEPLFVPEYWSPPSLFDLARTTGFDFESLIFSFGIGGVAAVLVNVWTRRRPVSMTAEDRHLGHHRFHRLALVVPFLLFPLLLVFGWNPIYPAIVAMFAGAVSNVACRRDLLRSTLLGAVIFVAYYLVFLLGLEILAPGYIGRVWRLDVLSGFFVLGLPLEELLFAAVFGAYWAGVYEHFTWHRPEHSHRQAKGPP